MKDKNNIVYIDGANLYSATKSYDWEFDYRRFRVWLSDKYDAKQVCLFLGLIPKYKNLYEKLQKDGYILIFKEVIYDNDGKVKGNCDADIVVRIMKDCYENNFEKAVLVSSDGDYSSLVSFLIEKDKLETILSPYNTEKCSVLLKRTGASIAYINVQKEILKSQ